MQVLTDQIQAARPGVVIYGIGDEEHQEHTSGHNLDDTEGVKAEDQDDDDVAEYRAIDVMPKTGSFTESDGDLLTQDLTQEPANQKRLIYVNWRNKQYHRKNGWAPVDNSDDYHGHVHVSGEADQDANTTPWVLPRLTVVQGQGETMLVQIKGDPSQKVYKSDGFYFEHMPSPGALAAWQAAGNKLITVPDQAAFNALCGKPISEKPPVQIVITDDQLVVLASTVSAGILGPMAAAQRASAEVLDQAAGE